VFARKCVEAGVTNYHVYLEAQRVVYLGTLGNMLVVWFDGAEQKSE